ncbi:ATP-binding protein [Lacinutrix sp. 5H-3-7-4]|uniref:sensor histidine kinase n=1 Tax=Lacinutrix sp. (strain 5H-3-7-4) TaxID=983544 RepID=UPI00020A3D84|nr:GAF domain-containing sensor histidine kinase [Lacinutrix sp. 5H-3-7-4]AEH02464.1 GAF sensor signal transduction histidine kinase [Lacinutrix sp. 5H-3-7-4]
MISPSIPENEAARLRAVKSYNLLDTLPESDFDTITALIASLFNVPIALVTLLDADRNFLKSHYGVPFNDSPRDISFCGHAILTDDDIFVVEDSRKDIRFQNNPLVKDHNAIFYAGAPLVNKDGFKLGTLCVFDTKPRKISKIQRDALIALSNQVVNLFELRKQNKELIETKAVLKERNEELKSFAGTVSHDMKMPLANLIVTSDIIKVKYGKKLDEKGLEYLNYLKSASLNLSKYITGLLEHYESDKIDNETESFDLHHLLEEIVDLLNINLNCEINFPDKNEELYCNRAALEQVFLNLIGNSLKYNDKEEIIIDIDCKKQDDHYFFTVKDNGIGIPKEKQKEIFNLFSTIGNVDRNGNKGHGIGLSTVRNIVQSLGGTISVSSIEGESTTFEFSILIEQ